MSSALTASEQEQVRVAFLAAYRYQHIFSGVRETRFPDVLGRLSTPAQLARIQAALQAL